MSYKEEALNPHNKFVLKDGVIKIVYGNEETTILKNHYDWCKENGRDTSWYKEHKETTDNVCMEAPKVLSRTKKK
jgi:hypothetical protein